MNVLEKLLAVAEPDGDQWAIRITLSAREMAELRAYDAKRVHVERRQWAERAPPEPDVLPADTRVGPVKLAWCVQRANVWCMLREQGTNVRTHVTTLCGQVVTTRPYVMETRTPTCPECRELRQSR